MSENNQQSVGSVMVCLCGSTRFKDAFIEANRSETLAGRIVLSVGMFGHDEGIDMNGPVKAMLDQLHLRKIDRADEILVVSKNGYIGLSTRREIEYALLSNKSVRWMEKSAKENFYGLAQGSAAFGGNKGQDEGCP